MSETINYYRGDTRPIKVTVQDDQTPAVAIDISGFTFTMTVSSSKDPADTADQQFQSSGVITDGPNGEVQFEPTSIDTDMTPGTYYYDVQMVDTAGKISTILKDKFKVTQDITKL